MTTSPKRRWLRFSLLTLCIFGGAVFVCWVGVEANLVHECRSVRNWLQSQGGDVYPMRQRRDGTRINCDVTLRPFVSLSIVRKSLGDYAVESVLLPQIVSADERDRVKAAFPESDLIELPSQPSDRNLSRDP